MTINKHYIYFDAARQSYVELLGETQEIKIITKEAIKKLLYDEYMGADFFDEAAFKRALKDIFLRIETVNLVFNPHREQEYKLNNYNTLNTYVPSEIIKKSIVLRSEVKELHNDINFLQETPHIKALLQNLFTSNERIFYFVNWFSRALVSNKKNQTAIFLRGLQGSGKGVLWEQIMEYAVGRNYCVTISNADLNSQFNANLENKLFILANEVKGDFREGNHVSEKLKMLISDSTLRTEQKGIDARFVENFFNIILFSNNAIPVQIQGSDRRYTIYETKSRPLKNVALEDFNENMRDFIKAIQDERDKFIENIFSFEYKDTLAMTVQETREKERIYRASMTKVEILADKIKNIDTYFFSNDFIELVEMLSEDKLKELATEHNIPLIYKEARLDLKTTIENSVVRPIAQIPIIKKIENNILVFVYKIFVAEDNSTKIGTALNVHFGSSFVERKGDKTVRYRSIEQENETLPF